MTNLKAGDKAPNFTGQLEDGTTVSLSDFKGKKLVIFFYPRDNSPTCTTEVCNFRDNYSKLKKLGFEILGVSPDSAKKHQNFIDKFELPFSLLVDSDLHIANAFGVFGPKKFMGKVSDAIHRETFVINEKGEIMFVIDKVKSKIASEQIFELIEK